MINQARTLLLNIAAPNDHAYVLDEHQTDLEEYIDYAFKPIELPEYLNQLHTVLYGNKPTRKLKNYRIRQLMPILHTSGLEPYVLKQDPRVTYLPFDNSTFKDQPDLLPLHVLPEAFTSVIGDNIDLFPDNFPFKQMWNSRLFVEKLGSILLSIVYRTEEVMHEMERRQVLGMDRDILPGTSRSRDRR